MTISFLLRLLLPSSPIIRDVINPKLSNARVRPILLNGLKIITPTQKNIFAKREYKPQFTRKYKKMALIVPFRYREHHLKKFSPAITEYLQNKEIDYEFIVVEQIDKKPFNRAKLMNIGASLASNKVKYFVFHDVDLLPINIDYRYANQPLKPFTFIENKYDKKVREYKQTGFGGVSLIPKNWFQKVNGFSNNYWHWGREDDDFLLRYLFEGATPYYDSEGLFITLPHQKSITQNTNGLYEQDKKKIKSLERFYKKNRKYYSKMARQLYNYQEDGLNTLRYTLVSDKASSLYRKIQVKL